MPAEGLGGLVRPRVLLKARPTTAQLADRLAAPVPDGVELYIHEDDVRDDGWLEALRPRFEALALPDDFTWIVEGPVWSLDGELFGLCRNDAVDRELTRRLVRLAQEIGAEAVNVHCVDGSADVAVLSEGSRALERALPYLEWYVALCAEAGVSPLVENVPPICRMRRSAFIFTPIGVAPEDLATLAQAVPGLGITLDTSHAQLAVNAFRGVAPEPAAGAEGSVRKAADHYRQAGGPPSLEAYIRPLLPWIKSAHVSNASGLLAEGLPYEEGDADLDGAVRLLATAARYLVTEPIDADDDHAVLKRSMQRRLTAVLGAGEGASEVMA